MYYKKEKAVFINVLKLQEGNSSLEFFKWNKTQQT